MLTALPPTLAMAAGPVWRGVRARRARTADCRVLLFVLAFFGVGSPVAAAQAVAERCAAELPAGAVHVQTQHAVPHVTYAHSAQEILAQLGGQRGKVALGLTLTSISLAMEVVLHRAESHDGAIRCARPEIDITLSHATMEVMLASEIEHDTCVAEVVLQHEMTHVAIERETLERAAESLSAQMQAHYRDQILFGSETELTAQLAQEFEQRWAPALDTLLQAANPRHAEFDERDSYGDKEACHGALIGIAHRIE